MRLDDIRHPPTEIITISELEETLMEYEGEPIIITYPMNTTQASESEDLSDHKHLAYMALDTIREGKSTAFNGIMENLGLSQETPIRFIRPESNDRWERIKVLYRELKAISPTFLQVFDVKRTQPTLEIKIDDGPITAILGDFKKMCKRLEQRMRLMVQDQAHPRDEQEAHVFAITQIYRHWGNRGGYRDEIAKIKRVNRNDIKCDLIGNELRKLRNAIEHGGHKLTINEVTNFIEKVQGLTPENIRTEVSVDPNKIVYVTAGAWCYHEEDCRHITRSSKPQVALPKGKAVKLEYQRCPDCTP